MGVVFPRMTPPTHHQGKRNALNYLNLHRYQILDQKSYKRYVRLLSATLTDVISFKIMLFIENLWWPNILLRRIQSFYTHL